MQLCEGRDERLGALVGSTSSIGRQSIPESMFELEDFIGQL